MPSIRTICYYAMYVIGKVESDHDWQAVNYNDPITIGMLQWYGTRAAALLNRVRNESSDYDTLAASLRESVESHDQDSSYWTSRYLTYAEGSSVQEVFASTANHLMQEEQAIEDFQGYITTLEGWGFSTAYPKPLIYAMAMYHQSPRQAGVVTQTAGGSATLDRIHEVCLNDGVLGRYRNRYTTVHDMLASWDGESDPPDFGQNGGVDPSGDSGGISTGRPQLSHIIQSGNVLVLYGNSFPDGLPFYRAQGQTWVCGTYTGGAPITGGNHGGGSGAVSSVVQLYISWAGRFAYSQAPGRLTPLESGYGDCSSTIWAAYHEAMGIDVGTWTGAMEGIGTHIAGGSGGTLPLAEMYPGDLVLFWRGGGTSSHVEMYIGDNKLMGHGGPGAGPYEKPDAQAYCARWTRWEVRRYA